MAKTDKDRQRGLQDSALTGHDANNPHLKRDPTANDAVDGPDGAGDGIQPQDTGEDLPATYEPDKRPSQRTTL